MKNIAFIMFSYVIVVKVHVFLECKLALIGHIQCMIALTSPVFSYEYLMRDVTDYYVIFRFHYYSM